MLKGDVSEVMLAVFAMLIGVLILALILPRMAGPVVQYYGTEQAITTANLLAGSINSLASVEEGDIIQDLKAPWGVYVYKKADKNYIVVDYFDERTKRSVTSRSSKGDDILVIGDVKPMNAPLTMSRLRIVKESGKPVEVRKI